jgi:nucleoside-diphosphate-sugar epimerase
MSSTTAWHEKRVLVTGAGGFLGSHLARALAALQPKRLTLLSRNAQRLQLLKGAEIVPLDLLDRAAVAEFFAKREFDYVFHLAGKVDQGVRPGIYAEQFRLHVDAAIHLTDALSGRPLERFIHVGSNAEYGIAPCPHPTTVQETPVTAYAASKLAGSKLVLARAQSEDLPATVVRPFLVYGSGQSEHTLLQQAIHAAQTGKDFAVTGGDQTRDFTAVEKFRDDILAVAMLPASDAVGRIYNLCTGIETSVREALALIQETYPAFNPSFASLPYRKTEVMHSAGEPFLPVTKQEAHAALRRFIKATR